MKFETVDYPYNRAWEYIQSQSRPQILDVETRVIAPADNTHREQDVAYVLNFYTEHVEAVFLGSEFCD